MTPITRGPWPHTHSLTLKFDSVSFPDFMKNVPKIAMSAHLESLSNSTLRMLIIPTVHIRILFSLPLRLLIHSRSNANTSDGRRMMMGGCLGGGHSVSDNSNYSAQAQERMAYIGVLTMTRISGLSKVSFVSKRSS